MPSRAWLTKQVSLGLLWTPNYEIEIEIVYNNTIINRLLSLGPPCYVNLGLVSLGYTGNH
jgi:hypothetical protein